MSSFKDDFEWVQTKSNKILSNCNNTIVNLSHEAPFWSNIISKNYWYVLTIDITCTCFKNEKVQSLMRWQHIKAEICSEHTWQLRSPWNNKHLPEMLELKLVQHLWIILLVLPFSSGVWVHPKYRCIDRQELKNVLKKLEFSIAIA